MTEIPFVRDISFDYGAVARLSPLIRRVIAENPGPFTYTGTGVYIIGRGDVAVIDPGPADAAHVAAILSALEPGETVSHILVTHTHADHSPAAALLQKKTGAPTFGFGPHGIVGETAEEGVDRDFSPDHKVRDGDVLRGTAWSMECVFTPGHASNHMCYGLREENALFTGDHVMGWSTSVISPPDGNLSAYMDSLRRLLKRRDEIYWPTHGPPINSPRVFVESLIAHREAREKAIVDFLTAHPARIETLVAAIYKDIDPRLHGAAGCSVLAHLEFLEESGRAVCNGPDQRNGLWRLVSSR